MITRIQITPDFMEHRANKESMYNKRGRDVDKFLMDLDCEIYEWHMMNIGEWQSHTDWRVDAQVLNVLEGFRYCQNIEDKSKSFATWYNIDVKFIKKWYNISNTKMLNFVKQNGIVDKYLFMEWVDQIDRPLQEGDIVEVRPIGQLSYEDLANTIQVSRGKWGGFYADVRSTI